MLDELAAAGRDGVAFVVAGDGQAWLLTYPDPAQLAAAMAGKPAEPWRHLPGAVLQDLLMDRVWQVRDDEATVSVEHDPAGAIRAADEAAGPHRRAGLADVGGRRVRGRRPEADSPAQIHLIRAQAPVRDRHPDVR